MKKVSLNQFTDHIKQPESLSSPITGSNCLKPESSRVISNSLYTNNLTALIPESQLNLKKIHNKIIAPDVIDDIKRDPVGYMSRLTYSESRIQEYLLSYDARFKMVYVSQQTVARDLGISEITVSRTLRKFRSLGIISSRQRWNDSCVYKLSPFFKKLHVRSVLQKLFPVLGRAIMGITLSISYLYPNHVPRFYQRFNSDDGLSNYQVFNLEVNSKQSYVSSKKSDSLTENNNYKTENMNILHKDREFSPILSKRVMDMELTLYGKCKLSAFPEFILAKAISECMVSMESAGLIPDRFEFLKNRCIEICQETGISPNWRFMYQLAELHGLSKDKLSHKTMMISNGTQINKKPIFSKSNYKSVDTNNKINKEPPKYRAAPTIEYVYEDDPLLQEKLQENPAAVAIMSPQVFKDKITREAELLRSELKDNFDARKSSQLSFMEIMLKNNQKNIII